MNPDPLGSILWVFSELKGRGGVEKSLKRLGDDKVREIVPSLGPPTPALPS